MLKELKIIMAELKQQHSWRLEDSECGSNEVNESWDKLKSRLEDDIKKDVPNYINDIVELIRSS